VTSPVAPTDAGRVALLLMDLQYGVLDTVGASDEVLSRAEKALSWAREQRVQVAHVRVAFTPEDFDNVPAHNKALAPLVPSRHFSDGSPEAAIHSCVAPQDDELLVRKTRFGAFSTTELHRRLQERRIETLILAGVSTSGVVLSTVRDAVDRDYEVCVLADAVADADPQTHRFLIEELFPLSANMIYTDDLQRYSDAWRAATVHGSPQ
jgi:nicotinamidase-related amidase